MQHCFNGFAKSVVESNQAQEAIDTAMKTYPRLNQLYEGLKWRLARRPAESGVKISRLHNKYILKTLDWSSYGVPVVRVIYSFTDNEVEILAIDILPITE